MKLTKQVKKAMALVLTTALVLSGQTVTKSNAQDTQEPQKEYKATVSTGLAQTETGGTTTTGSAISSTFRTITKTNKDTGEKTHRDIAESGWGDGKGIVYSFYIGNTDVVEIMKFNQPVLEVTDGDETGVSVVQLVSWKELKKMTDKKIDLTSLKKLYEEGTDNPEDGDWPGILVNVPAGRTISFRLYDAEPNGGNDSQATETPEDTATKLYFGMTDGSYVDYTKEIKLEGNGKYSFTVDNLTGENIKNLGYFEMDGDDNGVRLAMGQITVNGTYSMELDDEVGTASDLCYTELNPFHNSQNGLPNIWNPAGQSDVIARGENADLVGDGGEGIHLLVNKKYVPITEITYTFTVSGMSYDKEAGDVTTTIAPSEKPEGTPSVQPAQPTKTPGDELKVVPSPTVIPSQEPQNNNTNVVKTNKSKSKNSCVKLTTKKKTVVVKKGKTIAINFVVKTKNTKKTCTDKLSVSISNKKNAKIVSKKLLKNKAVIKVKGLKKGKKSVVTVKLGKKKVKVLVKVK